MESNEEGEAQVQRGAIETFKEFAATSFAVEHRTSILVLLAIIGVMGTVAYQTTPKESFPLLEYSANEKWNRDVSQLGADQPLLSPLGLEGLPNHDGSGSDLKSLWCGTFRIGALRPNVMTAFAETIEGRARLVHADGSARMRRRHSAVPLPKTSSRDDSKSRTRV